MGWGARRAGRRGGASVAGAAAATGADQVKRGREKNHPRVARTSIVAGGGRHGRGAWRCGDDGDAVPVACDGDGWGLGLSVCPLGQRARSRGWRERDAVRVFSGASPGDGGCAGAASYRVRTTEA